MFGGGALPPACPWSCPGDTHCLVSGHAQEYAWCCLGITVPSRQDLTRTKGYTHWAEPDQTGLGLKILRSPRTTYTGGNYNQPRVPNIICAFVLVSFSVIQEEIPDISKELTEMPQTVINCFGLAMHQVICSTKLA